MQPVAKNTFLDIFKSREVQLLLIVAVGYFLYNKNKKKEEKEDILSNLATNEDALLAQRLHTAFHPSISTPIFGWYPPDGTDEEAIKTIATQMGKKKNYTAVSQAFTTLFGQTLDEELRSEGVFDVFFNAYNAQSGGGTGGTPTTTPTTTNSKGWKKGDIVYSFGGWNLRSTTAPYGIVDKTVKGEDWILYNNPYLSTIGGVKGYWVVIQQPKSRYTFYPSYYVVFLDALYKK